MDNETIRMLTEYNTNPANKAIQRYYEADNIWKTLHIERDEKKHSAFLAWLFRQNVSNDCSPLKLLLNVLVRVDENQMDRNLKMAIIMNRLVIKSADIENETIVSKISKLKSNDRLDIYIKCDIDGVDGFSKLEIIIENKIDAQEGDAKDKRKKTGCEVWEKGKCQTERYYYACHENRQDESSLQLFVFLTGLDQEPVDKRFIKITYQNLVDYILQPYLEFDTVDEHTSLQIREYLCILGSPYNEQKSILATTMEEKELLNDFLTRNEALIIKAITVVRNTTTDPDKIDRCDDMLSSFKRFNGHSRQYTINGDGVYMMYQVMEEFAKYKLGQDAGVTDIETEIKKYVGKDTKKTYFSDEKDKVYRWTYKTKEGKVRMHYHEFDYGGKYYYFTKEWYGDKETDNFVKVMKGINEKYKDFQIEEIK